MKGIKYPKDYKKWMTIEELEIAKQIIADQKEDETTTSEWAEYAVREALGDEGSIQEIVTASAEIARNSRAYDRLALNSQHLDIWVSALAKVWIDKRDAHGEIRLQTAYLEIGAYISDIWESGATPYKHHMLIERFTKEG